MDPREIEKALTKLTNLIIASKETDVLLHNDTVSHVALLRGYVGNIIVEQQKEIQKLRSSAGQMKLGRFF